MSDGRQPPSLTDAVQLALMDLLTPDDEVDVTYFESDSSPAARVIVLAFADGARAGFEVVTTEPPAEVLAAVADGIQQVLIDRFHEARPQCPNHGHPAVATVIDGAAVWRCPQTEDVCLIGAYHDAGVHPKAV